MRATLTNGGGTARGPDDSSPLGLAAGDPLVPQEFDAVAESTCLDGPEPGEALWETERAGLRRALAEGHSAAAIGHYVQIDRDVQRACETGQKASSDRQHASQFQRIHRIGGHSEALTQRGLRQAQGCAPVVHQLPQGKRQPDLLTLGGDFWGLRAALNSAPLPSQRPAGVIHDSSGVTSATGSVNETVWRMAATMSQNSAQ